VTDRRVSGYPTRDAMVGRARDARILPASSQTPYVLLIDSSSRTHWMRDMILSILLTSVLTAILVCPLLAMSAIHRF
jgi:hypothetical protein